MSVRAVCKSCSTLTPEKIIYIHTTVHVLLIHLASALIWEETDHQICEGPEEKCAKIQTNLGLVLIFPVANK